MEDSKIVDLYWQRDEAAIAQTEKKYGSYLTTVAYNILADMEDSRESVNDTYLHAWNSMPPQKPGILSTYLSKITRRVSIDRVRRRTAQKRGGGEYIQSLSELADTVSSGDTMEERISRVVLTQAIETFLRTLPQDSRNIFIARYYFMDSLRRIASRSGFTEAKVKMLLFRTRQSLAAYLEKEGLL